MLKKKIQINKIVIGFISFILLVVVLLLFFHYYFLVPLKNNNEIFFNNEQSFTDNVNKDFKISTLSNGKIDLSEDMKDEYGISVSDVSGKINEGIDVYFIDGREAEEYRSMHVVGSRNIRTADIDSIYTLMKGFYLSDSEFYSSFFVILCHDGTRSADIASRLNSDNIKFLINGYKSDELFPVDRDGTSIFNKKIRNNDFTIKLDDAIEKIKNKNNLIIDGRLYSDYYIPDTYNFRIGRLSSDEYDEKLKYILGFINSDIVYIADIYPDLFYAKLLAQRLSLDFNFNINNFYVLFSQSEKLYNSFNKQ